MCDVHVSSTCHTEIIKLPRSHPALYPLSTAHFCKSSCQSSCSDASVQAPVRVQHAQQTSILFACCHTPLPLERRCIRQQQPLLLLLLLLPLLLLLLLLLLLPLLLLLLLSNSSSVLAPERCKVLIRLQPPCSVAHIVKGDRAHSALRQPPAGPQQVTCQ